MRRTLYSLLIAVTIVLSGLLSFRGISRSYAGSEGIEDQFANILIEQSSQGKIGVVVLDFSATGEAREETSSENELKDAGIQYTKKFIASIVKRIADAGKQGTVTVLDRPRLDDILREKKMRVVGLNELSLAPIGHVLDLDLLITGNVQVEGDFLFATAKLTRLKDGEVLSLAKERTLKNAVFKPHPPVVMIDAREKLKIGAWKAIPLSLTLSGTLNVVMNVVHGNAVDLYVIPASELINVKNEKAFRSVEQLKALKMKKYNRSAALSMGDYFLVLHDSSLGLFSAESSDIEISAHFVP
jgi:curli production assembly/transport component CsgG